MTTTADLLYLARAITERHSLRHVRTYIASASDNRDNAAALAHALRSIDTPILSTWHDLPPWDRAKEHELPRLDQCGIAATCANEIRGCSALIVLGHPACRGALWELGFAYGLGLKVLWVGDTSVSLFSSLCAQINEVGP